MYLPDFEYFRPETIGQACSFLEENKGKAKVLAGGTDILVRLKQRTTAASYLIGISGLPGLDYVHYDDGEGLRLGPATPIHNIESSRLIGHRFPLLAQAARLVASPQIRHRATLAGNLCLETRCPYYNQSDFWRASRPLCYKTGGTCCHAVPGSKRCYAVFCSDLAPAMLALDARVKVGNARGTREMPLADLYTGTGDNPFSLEADDIILEILIPPPLLHPGSAYLKHASREAVDFGLVTVAVAFAMKSDSACSQARVVLGCVASAPVALPQVAAGLTGKTIDDHLAEELGAAAVKTPLPLAPISGSPAFKRKIIGVLVGKAILQAAAAARNNSGQRDHD